MDAESWYSVTPECISKYIADKCYHEFQKQRRNGENGDSENGENYEEELKEETEITEKAVKMTRMGGNLVLKGRLGLILDLFCGCGGNSIPLAAVADRVVSVDIIAEKLVDAG